MGGMSGRATEGSQGPRYECRRPKQTPLYAAVVENWRALLAQAEEVGRGLSKYVQREFSRHLECGVLAHGFAMANDGKLLSEVLRLFIGGLFSYQRRVLLGFQNIYT